MVLQDAGLGEKLGVDLSHSMLLGDEDLEIILRFIHRTGRSEKAIRRKCAAALVLLQSANVEKPQPHETTEESANT